MIMLVLHDVAYADSPLHFPSLVCALLILGISFMTEEDKAHQHPACHDHLSCVGPYNCHTFRTLRSVRVLYPLWYAAQPFFSCSF